MSESFLSPLRESVAYLQQQRIIRIDNFTWGFAEKKWWLKLDFEILSTREQVRNVFEEPDMKIIKIQADTVLRLKNLL